MKQIVLHISDIHGRSFIHAGRILSYLNRFFVKYMSSMQYCEDLADGFLFVFRDFEALKIRTKPLTPDLLENINTKVFSSVNFFKFFFVSRKNFPSQGVDIQVKVEQGIPDQVLPYVQAFLSSVDSRITFTEISPDILLFHISTYDIIHKYLNSLIRRFYLRQK